jgi:hypothetical protein
MTPKIQTGKIQWRVALHEPFAAAWQGKTTLSWLASAILKAGSVWQEQAMTSKLEGPFDRLKSLTEKSLARASINRRAVDRSDILVSIRGSDPSARVRV